MSTRISMKPGIQNNFQSEPRLCILYTFKVCGECQTLVENLSNHKVVTCSFCVLCSKLPYCLFIKRTCELGLV